MFAPTIVSIVAELTPALPLLNNHQFYVHVYNICLRRGISFNSHMFTLWEDDDDGGVVGGLNELYYYTIQQAIRRYT